MRKGEHHKLIAILELQQLGKEPLAQVEFIKVPFVRSLCLSQPGYRWSFSWSLDLIVDFYGVY